MAVEENDGGSGIHDTISNMLGELGNSDEAEDSADTSEDSEESEEQVEADGEDGAEESDKDEDGLPTDYEELRRGFLRQSDYTRKTQALSAQRKELEKQLKELEELKEQFQSQLQRAPKPGAVSEDVPAQPPADATAEELLQWYVKQEVMKAQQALQQDLAPLKSDADNRKLTTSVVSAYSEVLDEDGTDPVFSTKSAAELVGQIIESDEDLMDLAKSNPKRAIRLAMKTAKLELAGTKARKKSDAAKAATPLRSSSGRAAGRALADPMEAAREALRQFRQKP